MSIKRKRELRRLTRAELDEVAATLIGMTLRQADMHVLSLGILIADHTEPGWYSGPTEANAIVVVRAADGTIARAEPA